MSVDRKDKRFFDFMCSCGDKGEERCEKVYDEVMAEFKDYYGNQTGIWKKDITDKDFVHSVVIGLDRLENGQANIEHIYSDMWSGIAVNYQHYQEDPELENQKFWVECDEIHHGLARIYQLVKEFDESLNDGSVAQR